MAFDGRDSDTNMNIPWGLKLGYDDTMHNTTGKDLKTLILKVAA